LIILNFGSVTGKCRKCRNLIIPDIFGLPETLSGHAKMSGIIAHFLLFKDRS
jgi:hypothetical protein